MIFYYSRNEGVSTMKHVIFLLCLVLTVSISGSLLAQNPSWQEFTVESKNGIYIAQIFKSVTAGINESSFQLRVLERSSGKTLWSSRYNYDGSPGGVLSDNGAAFAYVDKWYWRDNTVATIYFKGQRIHEKRGRDFAVDEAKLLKAGSRLQWLQNTEKYRFTLVSGALALEINAIDGKQFLVNAESGGLIR
jgi:hypothetical protein